MLCKINDRVFISVHHVVALEMDPVGMEFPYRVVLVGGISYGFKAKAVFDLLVQKIESL